MATDPGSGPLAACDNAIQFYLKVIEEATSERTVLLRKARNEEVIAANAEASLARWRRAKEAILAAEKRDAPSLPEAERQKDPEV